MIINKTEVERKEMSEMNTRTNILMMFVAIAITLGLVGVAAQPVSAASQLTCNQWHTVQRGEYLVKIARMYNTTWRELAELNGLVNPSRIYPGQKLCVSGSASSPIPVDNSYSGVRVYALSVREDEYVELKGMGLAAGSTYTVYMRAYGHSSGASVRVGSATTDKYGAFTRTFFIPGSLVDVPRIEARLYNTSGDSASNWFINATSEELTGGNGAPAFSFRVLRVVEDEDIELRTSNLPADVPFKVLMGKSGSKGVDGIQVGSVRDGDGVVKAIFDIPTELQGRSRIDIRMENEATGIYYYLTIENEDYW